MALPNYKDIVELLKKGSTLEAQEKIMELREASLELQEENLALGEEVSNLKARLSKMSESEFDGHVYWRNSGGDKDGAFCPKCFDTKDQSVRLHKDGIGWWCHTCKVHFGPSDYT